MKNTIIFFSLIIILIACAQNKAVVITYNQENYSNVKALDYWHYQDLKEDSIPGISLYNAFKHFSFKDTESTIVAIIDTEVAITHPDLKESIWVNSEEIPENGIDDDNNGYIDDINGWNFLGDKNGESTLYNQYEYTRIVNSLTTHPDVISKDSLSDTYILYSKAKEKLDKETTFSENVLKRTPFMLSRLRLELDNPLLPKEGKITNALLDSLINQKVIVKEDVNFIYQANLLGLTLNDLVSDSINYSNKIKKHLNINYNDRALINDDPANFNKNGYGNRYVNNHTKELYHGTLVAGVFTLGPNSQDYSDKIQLMPICISNNGDENDKDMYHAIKYATDNGANIINISSGKSFSLNRTKVLDAIKYASKNNVLIVVAAGNDNEDLDMHYHLQFPNDTDTNNHEIVNSFIRVGGSSYQINEKLKLITSNYGASEVDIFAPGDSIYTTSSRNKISFKKTSGTSFAAPQVSLVAALIRSYYPSLTASEVKKILMDSSVKYDILVDVPTKENPDQQLPFNELSKSGGIVNAYNAMLMAAEFVKAKKKK